MASRRAVGVAIELVAVAEVLDEKFVDGQVTEHAARARHSPVPGLELREQACVLCFGFLRPVATK